MFKKSVLSVAVTSALVLAGCGSNDSSSANVGATNTIEGPLVDEINETLNATTAVFNPGLSQLPFPTDILFALETAGDGTFAANSRLSAVDHMDGGSTIAPIDLTFTGELDPDSLDATSFAGANPNPNQNVFLLRLTYPSGDGLLQADDSEIPTFALGIAARAGDTATIAKETNYRAELISVDGGTNNVLRITPLQPLDPGTKYLVLVTDGVLDVDGDPVRASIAFQELAGDGALASTSLVPVREAVQGWLTLAEGWFNNFTNGTRQVLSLDPIDADNVALANTFTTAGTSTVLASIADPSAFFAGAAASTARKNAIRLLNDDTLSLDATSIASIIGTDDFANDQKCLNVALLSTVTDNTSASYVSFLDPTNTDDYDPSITAFSDIPSTDSTNIYILQATAAEIGNRIANGELPAIPTTPLTCGDGATNAQEGDGTVAALSGLLPTGTTFPTPTPRAAAFYTTLPNTAFGLANTSTLFLGQITLPYYLSAPTDSDADNLAEPWDASTSIGGAIDTANGAPSGTTPPSDKITYRFPFPEETATVDVPVLVQVPDSGVCAANCPIVIYQHGIFGNRSHSLALGNQLAASGFATVAIDLPLHGVAPELVTRDALDPALPLSVDVDSSNNFAPPAFKTIATFENLSERHFGWGNPTGGAPARMVYGADADAAVGASGTNFINLQALEVSRDNLRQAVVDLLNLNASLGNISTAVSGFTSPGPTLNTSQVYFVGHSLGGIAGSVYSAVNNISVAGNSNLNPLSATALITTGGGVPRLLENSASIGTNILAGLAAAGNPQGSSTLELFFNVAQGTVDSADPINWAPALAASNNVYINEIYGDGSNRATQDQTIPPAADELYDGEYTAPLGEANPAPLAGSEPLIAGISPTAVSANGATGGDDIVVRFTAGTHTTIIQPLDATQTAVFADMATNIISFFASNGAAISFNNATFVKTDTPPGNP